MTTPVNFELAKLLKEKGFDKPTVQFYTRGKKPYLTEAQDYMSDRYTISNWNNGMGSYPTKDEDVCCSAPTIAEVVMWLYKKYGIWIEVYMNDDTTFGYLISKVTIVGRIYYPIKLHFDLPTEAYEAAIKYTMENLI
jgi:hypothetical protein